MVENNPDLVQRFVRASMEGWLSYFENPGPGNKLIKEANPNMTDGQIAYRPDRALDWLRPAMRVCADLGLMVKLHTGDGPYSIPTEFYPIIREFPSVNFVLAHFGVQTGGVYVFEPFQMAMDAPNIYVESGWCLQSRIVEFAKELPRHKILFGSDTPPNEPGMWLRLLEVLCHEPPQGLNLDEDTLEDYFGNNVARMIGLDPTPPPRSVAEAPGDVLTVEAEVSDDQDATALIWALATHFQPHRDVIVVEGLPGNALDPSASGIGTTSRMGLDATRGPGFDGVLARIGNDARARAAAILAGLGPGR